MTANQLKDYFNETFGRTIPWPLHYHVDAETYGNCCQAVFNNKINKGVSVRHTIDGKEITICPTYLGPNQGLMFKDVELLIKESV